ncbi:hypothetical protein SmJEL517_g04256 [Synchytrium microbalum]|uniref:Glutamine amidotransferase type-2 domain-containing protein n=1 Tax=Synchytrium microbalum TaxID=1806994 RepID=A0A507BZ99_9FUNG|nr:uncharacterized protein SmJEL517_g04256 [Synchytrium microbalum]TPX32752.1 hypothetical protein SmJEL517_g04256 [Synchytrium microbalum]
MSRRGPDAVSTVSIPFLASSSNGKLSASVLSLRGNGLTRQPVKVGKLETSYFCWNGEVYRRRTADGHTAHMDDDIQGSDTQMMATLVMELGFEAALSQIHGEYATLLVNPDSTSNQHLWMARDRLGRRSLLWHREPGLAVVSSVGPVLSDRTQNAIDCLNFEEVPSDCIYSLQVTDTELVWTQCPHPVSLPAFNRVLPEPENIRILPSSDNVLPSVDYEEALTDSMNAISSAVSVRVLSAPTASSGKDARIAVLFSGGLDSSVLAYYAHVHLPLSEPIDLINVSFENPRTANDTEDIYDVPDRKTGRRALQELRRLAPNRQWQFVEVDVPFAKVTEYRSRIIDLMAPLNSVMDLSIALAFWFAARGIGHLRDNGNKLHPYTSAARVLLSGLGADEQLAGYSRHAGRFQSRSYAGLVNELAMDVERLPYRNLGRDDRIMADHGREVRFPFLDELVMNLWSSLPIYQKADLRLGKGIGDKLLLRWVAERVGLGSVATEAKRAVQFGSRTAKMMDNSKGHEHVMRT